MARACSPPPPSMRTSSWMRVSPLTGKSRERVRPPVTSFSTTKCSEAVAATCGKVGDGHHLVAGAQRGHLAANRARDLAADVGVDLIEHHQRRVVLIGERGFHGEHHAADLAGRGDLAQRQQRLAGIRAELELDGLETLRPGFC
jgi:hypothetical protein